MEYTLLDSDSKIEKQCLVWKGLDRIAVDLEGEFNLHVYGEHLCLIQVFDGTGFYIIDPRAKGVTRKGLAAFFSSSVKKLWFDCQSDQVLVFKKYGLKIENILDLRVLAVALGFCSNLIALEKEYLGIDIAINKKKNQQANWLKRPLEPALIEYALLDVAHLMELEDVLEGKIAEKQLERNVENAMKHATELKPIEPGWKRVGSWRHYNDKQKLIVKYIYIEREKLAKRFNVPASFIMDKHKIIDFARNTPQKEEELAKRLDSISPRFKRFLIPAVQEALKRAKADFDNKIKA